MLTAASPLLFAAGQASLEQRLNALEAQNQLLRQELDQQKQTIRDLQSRLASPSAPQEPLDLQPSSGFNLGRLRISGEGGVGLFCSIHSQMNCVILVLQNPFFAATDRSGRFKIENVPAGTYKLKAWHERLPFEIKDVVVPEQGEVEINFTLGIKGLPKY